MICVVSDIKFEQLGRDETILLLRAFDYELDLEGYVLTPSGSKIASKDYPNKFLKVEDIALTPGSLKVIDSSPDSISKFIREKIGDSDV